MQYNNCSSNNSKQIMSNNSIKDNFRTPLTPLHMGGRERLHRGGLGGLHKYGLEENFFSYNDTKKENVIASKAWRSCEVSSYPRLLRRIFNTPRNDSTYWKRLLRRFTPLNDGRTAFSLIELSIVLIIIGLLIAGVTGGKSLIESAKTRAFINELESYKRAVYTSLAVNDRLPGDLNKDSYSGPCKFYDHENCAPCVIETYTSSSFSAPYNTTETTPHTYVGPFVDLYLSGIMDFKPNPSYIRTYCNSCPGSKIVFNKKNYSDYVLTSYKQQSSGALSASSGKDVFIVYLSSHSDGDTLMPLRIANRIDEKIDDGNRYDGDLQHRSRNRAEVYSISYIVIK